MTDKAKMKELITDLAGDLKELVTEIEDGVPSTMNHYGKYMNVIATVGAGDITVKRIVALALVEAGANHAGVKSALNLSV